MIVYEGEEADRRPVGWESVELGADLDAFCEAAEREDFAAVEEIVGRAYARAYARLGGDILREVDDEL